MDDPIGWNRISPDSIPFVSECISFDMDGFGYFESFVLGAESVDLACFLNLVLTRKFVHNVSNL